MGIILSFNIKLIHHCSPRISKKKKKQVASLKILKKNILFKKNPQSLETIQENKQTNCTKI